MDQDDLECQLLDKLKSIQSHDRSCFWREIILHHEKGRTGNRPVVQIDRYLQASIARTSSFDAFLQVKFLSSFIGFNI